jgi:hypothetical protein
MVNELENATEGDSLQIRREGDDINMILGRRGSECLGVAIKRDVCKEIRDNDSCTDFEVLKVKVPFIFLGTMGFSARREGR